MIMYAQPVGCGTTDVNADQGRDGHKPQIEWQRQLCQEHPKHQTKQRANGARRFRGKATPKSKGQ